MLDIQCNSCSEKYEDYINYEHYRQDDDIDVLICPKCKNQICYDSIKAEGIKIMDWLHTNDRTTYFRIVSQYFKPLLDLE
jgi:uncharacterized protein YbaR (Trm112 family)